MDGRIRPLFLASIDEALEDLLGTRVRQNIYNCLQERGIRRDDIPNNLDFLVAFLDQNLGKGSKVIQNHIARRLHEKLGWEKVNAPTLGLSDYVEQASQRIHRFVSWQPSQYPHAKLKVLLANPIP